MAFLCSKKIEMKIFREKFFDLIFNKIFLILIKRKVFIFGTLKMFQGFFEIVFFIEEKYRDLP
jgi:hypothetical protein